MIVSTPSVALVGGGPGDPELLTLRAEELLGRAGVVVVDAGLANLVQQFTRGAEVVAVPEGRPAVTDLLAAAGRAAGPVVRLYRGDPWLHAAHEVERAALEGAGVPTESVAGVAVEVAVPALVGVPVHVRQLAVVCTLGPWADLPAAVDPARTLVAAGDDPGSMARAMAATGDASLPAALVPLAAPRAPWRGPLAGAALAGATMAGPALLVVGAVCGVGSPPAMVDGAARGPHGAAGGTLTGWSGDVASAGAGPVARERV